MRRVVCLILALMLAAGLSLADEKKAKDKIKKAEVDLQRGNVNGAEKNLRGAIEEDPNSVEAHDSLGRLYSLTRRYSAAAKEFSTAVTLDDQHHKFNEDQRRRMIDDQGVAYALGGYLDKARDIYLKALEKDPEYAMYNYNLACVYAELHDLDAALPYLKKSWENRGTLPSDIRYPDPRQDNSFKPYVNNPKFQEAVQNIVQ
jgi:Tfp pilus assembly protein PilF